MKRIVIVSIMFIFLLCYLSLTIAQEKSTSQVITGIPKDFRDPVPSEKFLGNGFKDLPKPDKISNQPPTGAPGSVSTGMFTFYDYQSNGGPIQYLEVNPNNPAKIYTIFMSSSDSLDVLGSRRTTYTYSTNYGQTWDDYVNVPNYRSGFPGMTFITNHPILGDVTAIVNHANHPNDPLNDIRTLFFLEQEEGAGTFATFLPPIFGTYSDPLDPNQVDEPIWPQVAYTTGGYTVISAIRADNDGIFAVTMDPNGIFANWQEIDTTYQAATTSLQRGPNNKVAVIWRSTGDTAEICYRLSTNNGISWGPKQVVDRETDTYLPYWQGLDAIFIGDHLYIVYPAASIENNGLPYASWKIRLWNSNSNNVVTVIDSNNFPFLMRSKPVGAIGDGYHSTPLTYPEIAVNSTGSRIYVACDAFIQGQYDAYGGFYGDILLTYSDNGGATWSRVKNITRTPNLDERYVAISTINPKINDSNYVFLAYQEDWLPGSYTQDGKLSKSWWKFMKINTDFKPTKDIGIVSVNSVNYSGIHALDIPETVKVIIENNGTETPPPSTVTLTYKVGSAPNNVDDGTKQVFTSISWNGLYAYLTFSETWTPKTSGNVKVFVRAFYTGDQDGVNDVSERTITIAPAYDLAVIDIIQKNRVLPKAQPPLPAIQVDAVVRNVGSYTLPAGGYLLKWSLDGIVQTPVGRSPIPHAMRDSVPLSYNPSERGTYILKAWTELTEDTTRYNDTLTSRVYAYPGSAFCIAYDDSDDFADSFWGVDNQDSALTAAVRFTASKDMALMNVDAYFDNRMTDTTYPYVKIRVWAAGTDSTPGALIYQKEYTSLPYVVIEGPPDWVSFPISSGLVFREGEDFWVGLTFLRNAPRRTYFPMGIDELDTPLPFETTPRRDITSWFSEDDGLTWWPIRDVLIPKPGGKVTHNFVIRAIGIDAAPGGVFNVSAAWNMISIPVQATGSKSYLFPTSISKAFKFVPGTGYVEQNELSPGPAYWLKFPSAQRVDVVGSSLLTNLTIPVSAGWNMIGSISSTIPVANVNVPGGAGSNFFAYSAGYVPVSTISPGKGYWIKANQAGDLTMSSTLKIANPVKSPDISSFNKLIVNDAQGNKQVLYFGENVDGKFPVNYFELPPTTPEGIFDVRFASQRMLEAYPTEINENLEYNVLLKDVAFPINVTYEIVNRTKDFVLVIGNRSVKLDNSKGNIKIENSELTSFALKVDALDNVPTEFTLSQNYPNPFNPSTKFEFAVPKTSRVEIVVYDILGSKVATLFDGVKNAGYHSIEWNGTNSRGELVPSGVYFVKMTSDGFSSVKKAVMMK